MINHSLRLPNFAALNPEKPFVISPPEEDEEHIILRAQADARSFRPLYEKYFKKIYFFVLHRVGEKEFAADITQQVFFKALSGIQKFQFRGLPFSSWLFRVAINECNDYFRKSRRVRVVTLSEATVKNLHEELMADTTEDELAQKIPAILQQLKPQELTLIELRFFEGRSFREIGELSNITELNAKVRTYRTLQKMKKLFLK